MEEAGFNMFDFIILLQADIKLCHHAFSKKQAGRVCVCMSHCVDA